MRAVRESCDKSRAGCLNVIGAELADFNSVSALFYAEKMRRAVGYRCEYTSLGYLEQALDAAGVPYRAETSSLVYSSREVRDLLTALRAIDDPSDTLSLVVALRSSLFGCGDDDLFRFKVEHRGRWDVTAPPPATLPADDPVIGIAWLDWRSGACTEGRA